MAMFLCTELMLRVQSEYLYTLLAKSKGRFLFLIFENFSIGRMFSILETILLGRSTTFSQNKKWCQMINPMCTAFKM